MSLSLASVSTSAIATALLRPLVKTLADFFASRRVEAYLVGGAVRDALLGRETGDVDVAVAADAQRTGSELAAALGGHLIVLDRHRDIVRVVVPGALGPRLVDLSSFQGKIVDDLWRRDFTVDAMAVALPPADASPQPPVIDPFGGLSDIRDRLVRARGPSVFEEDPARLLRAPRLAAQLRFEVAEDTARLVRQDAPLVNRVAPERIRDELLKLLAEPPVAHSLRLLDRLGLLCRVIPELAEAKGVAQPKEHYWDVFDHLVETAASVEAAVQGRPGDDAFIAAAVPRFEAMNEHFAEQVSDGHSRLTLLKLAGLLHDVAKPATRTVESSGRVRFLGHEAKGAEVAEGILRRLRFSGRGAELVRLMVRYHLRPSQMAQGGELPTGKAIYRYYRDVGDAAIDTLYLNMADYLAARGPQLRPREWSDHCQVIGHILRQGLGHKAPDSLPKLVDGRDLMGVFSLSPGPQVGILLGLVREAQANGEVTTRQQALELVKANLDSGAGRA